MVNSVLAPVICALALSSAAPNPRDGGPGTPPEGLTIKNARYVGDSKKVIRGHAPNDNVAEFKAAGITHVLIIKNQNRTEVDDEIKELHTLGLDPANIYHIPYRWKDLEPQTACEQTIEALEFMHNTEAIDGSKLYVHCTAGIDRTGLVSALFRLQKEPGTKIFKMFKDEMCQRGYGDANYFRPKAVIDAIHKDLTPLYIKLAQQIIKNRKTGAPLSREFCKPENFQSPALEKQVAAQLDKFKCRTK